MTVPVAELVRLLRQRYQDMGDTLTRQAADVIERLDRIRIAGVRLEKSADDLANFEAMLAAVTELRAALKQGDS